MLRVRHWMLAASLLLSVGVAGAAEVLLGPGDVVRIGVYGSPDMGIETRVSEAGTITFPLLGQVGVGGLAVAAVSCSGARWPIISSSKASYSIFSDRKSTRLNSSHNSPSRMPSSA